MCTYKIPGNNLRGGKTMIDNVYVLVYLITNILDAFVVMNIMRTFFKTEGVYISTELCLLLIRFIVSSLVYLFAPYPLITMMVTVLTTFLITFSYSSRVLKKILVTIFTYMYMFACELIVAAIVGISNFSPILKSEQGNMFCFIMSELLAIIFITFLKNLKNSKNNFKVSWTFFCISLLVSIITIYLEIQIFMQENISNTTYALSMTSVLILNFTIFYLYDSISKSFHDKIKSEIEKHKIIYYRNEVKLIHENSEALKQFRHDVKNRLIVLKHMIEDNKTDEAVNYISLLTDQISNITLFSETGNLAIDSIINYKLTQALHLGIKTDAEIILPKQLHICEDDFVVILGNLLDNAIEAASKMEDEKYVNLSIRYQPSNLIILLRNSFDGKVNVKNDVFDTTKSNRQLHGIGLRSIESTIQKYHGEMLVEYNDREFYTKMILITG